MGKYHWYPLLTVFAVLALAQMVSLGFMIRLYHQGQAESRDNDRKWCTLLVQMDDAYKSNPPGTQVGKDIAAAIHQRVIDLGC